MTKKERCLADAEKNSKVRGFIEFVKNATIYLSVVAILGNLFLKTISQLFPVILLILMAVLYISLLLILKFAPDDWFKATDI